MVTIIDYGIGNLRSIEKAFQSMGVNVLRTDRREDIERAERLVLPGVGAFGSCIDEIRRRGLVEPILNSISDNKPFLGVCIGMQLLFEGSEELGPHKGLGILPGRVVRFSGEFVEENGESGTTCETESSATVAPVTQKVLKIPHMGWNTVTPRRPSPLLDGIAQDSFFYFVHSFHAAPDDEGDILATTEYGITFPAIVQRNNVYGVQFHPEKSQRNGMRILNNFSRL